MDAREERGLAIAARCKIDRRNGVWLVPSQSGNGKYAVIENGAARKCSCPDYEDRQLPCKHIYAVEFVIQRELFPDGSETVTRSMTVTERVTYKQDWPAYNEAQSHEKDRFQILLNDLCSQVAEPERQKGKPGRKPHPIKDAIFASVFKVYSTFSSRRFSCDLRDAHAKGYTASSIPGLKVIQFLENPELAPILAELIARSAAPLRTVETEFAVDSSGFSSSRFDRWYDHKYGVPKQKAVWVKVHISCGVKTNVVTAVRILGQAADGPQLPPLMKETAKTFTVKEVSGDKAYSSQENLEAVDELGGTGFYAFKANATGGIGGLFGKMFHYFQFRREEFLQHYHKRSNVESTFSAIKRKFGDSVRSRTDVAMVNEVLCKLLAHNICCLIQEQAELGIEPVFWTDRPEGPREVLAMAN